ncbi:lysine 2,3-aminomutase [Sorangium cellulosum]|uniref:Lysine 2,3-aminomutase n=1 Tax=Sorangium cellulosum TaxID=56 RepID=A0A4P2Q137_SORCE|nr:lysine 2,3-aminomutase [Sorangium cellulosum]AUX22880.1 lysine 2,3-aminomutase [Sorangium cellulosum]
MNFRKLKIYEGRDIDDVRQLAGLSERDRAAMKAVAAVLPFRVNDHVLEELIDWDAVPDDPIYQLTFPQPGMLAPGDLQRMMGLMSAGASPAQIRAAAREIQMRLNPHPAGQMELNVPRLDGQPLRGMQHKYRETVLFFPAQGQTCHAYCTYCFRWPQFVGLDDEMKFASREAETLLAYLRAHPEVTNVLFTGGDPLLMKTAVLRRYIEPLLRARLPHLVSIRIGTKAPAYWPHRFVTDADADDLLRLFEEIRAAGMHIALMAHFSHPRELEPPIAEEAVRRIRSTGAVVRCQAPLIRHVNDDPTAWATMWAAQVRLGAVPYYMFVERDTGARGYFEVPLARAAEIFRVAYRSVSGLARTVRGPSMSATPGKVLIHGVARVGSQQAFVLQMLQARDPEWVGRPFFAAYDPAATWFDQLRPLAGDDEFFFERELQAMKRERRSRDLARRSLPVFGVPPLPHAAVS